MSETVWTKDTPMYPNGVVMKDGMLYVPARTCEMLGSLYYDSVLFDESYWETDLSCGHTVWTLDEFNYKCCPYCEARVVYDG